MLAFFDANFLKKQILESVFNEENISYMSAACQHNFENDEIEKRMFFEWLLKRFFRHIGFKVLNFPDYEDYEFAYRNIKFDVMSYIKAFFTINNFVLDNYRLNGALVSLLVSGNTLILSLEEKY